MILQIIDNVDDRGGRGREAFAQVSVNIGEGFAGDEAPGLSQTSEAPDGPSKLMRARPSKLMRIKEKIFRRCLSRDSQCLLSAKALERGRVLTKQGVRILQSRTWRKACNQE